MTFSVKKMTKKIAAAIVGKLSQTSKLGCYSWGIPAEQCRTGSKLRLVVGSVCSMCYALKGSYVWRTTRKAYARRLSQYSTTKRDAWIDAMCVLLCGQAKFRWFDSGDLQDVDMLDAICAIARRLPTCKFWLPTREYAIVNRYTARHDVTIPSNLNIILSAHLIDGKAPHGTPYATSVVVKVAKRRKATKAQLLERYRTAQAKLQVLGIDAKVCPSSIQQGMCGACTTCFDIRQGETVAYISH